MEHFKCEVRWAKRNIDCCAGNAAQEALATVAVGAGGTPEQLAQAQRAAAGKLKKVVNDSSKKQRLD